MPELQEINERLSTLETQATEALAGIEGGNASQEQIDAVKATIEGDGGIKEQIATLTEERNAALRDEEQKAMRATLGTLQETIAQLQEPAPEFPEFQVGPLADPEGKGLNDIDKAYAKGEFSIYNDMRRANKGDGDALARLTNSIQVPAGERLVEGKAMTEGTAAQGGYLVRPLVERQIVEARELDNVLRGLCSKLTVNTNSISLDQIGLTTTAGWVAELAAKPESTGLTLASVTASVFTAAGLATISNQLLADSNPDVDRLVTRDLAKRLIALEEAAFINGTGVNQPLGILQTPGLGSTALTNTTAAGLIDAILDAISQVETDHGAPSAILLHPRTWTFILKAKDTAGAWLLGPPTVGAHADVRQNRTVATGPTKSLWGYPVITSNRIPTNLGAGTDESRVIVGDFSEALILDRQGITVDESSHVYFTTNQTVFRAEQRVGFTAARTPLAFNVVGGAGLAGH